MDFTPVTSKKTSFCLSGTFCHICTQGLGLLLNVSIYIGDGKTLQNLSIKILEVNSARSLIQENLYIQYAAHGVI